MPEHQPSPPPFHDPLDLSRTQELKVNSWHSRSLHCLCWLVTAQAHHPGWKSFILKKQNPRNPDTSIRESSIFVKHKKEAKVICAIRSEDRGSPQRASYRKGGLVMCFFFVLKKKMDVHNWAVCTEQFPSSKKIDVYFTYTKISTSYVCSFMNVYMLIDPCEQRPLAQQKAHFWAPASPLILFPVAAPRDGYKA